MVLKARQGISGVQPSADPDQSSGRPGQPATRSATSRRGGSQPASSTPISPAVPWILPNIADILDPTGQETVKTNQDIERGKVIEDTLASFGAPVRVVATNHGPVVTQFGVEPLFIENRNGQTRVRVSKIVALADDLALALAAPRIRIQAPVPGRNYVGIEVPNLEISRVLLREVMESDTIQETKVTTAFCIGKRCCWALQSI